jgi:rubrerythrin
MTAHLRGASVWESELYEHLTTHEQHEQQLLVEYQKAADASESPAFQYLTSLIVEDEKRHHRVFQHLASALKTDAEFLTEEPAVPRIGNWGPDLHRVMELTDQLVERERADARELRRLSDQLKDFRDTTMWSLLVKMMEMDTAKHIEILNFVKRKVRNARR